MLSNATVTLHNLPVAAKDPAKFVVPYALGNIVALFGTGFLVGPASQCKKMFAQTRIIATCVYLFTLAAVLVVASVADFSGKGALLIFMVIIQMMAMVWYAASYIPFARKMIVSAITSFCPCFK